MLSEGKYPYRVVDIEFETIALKPLHRGYLTVAISKLDRYALVTGTTVERHVTSEILLFLTGHRARPLVLLVFFLFQVALSVLTVSIATKIFRIGN